MYKYRLYDSIKVKNRASILKYEQYQTVTQRMFRKKGVEMVRRIYVEKKEGFQVEAAGILNDIKNNLHVTGISAVRVINRYDIEGISDDTYEKSRCTVFAEPAVDVVCDEELPEGPVSVFLRQSIFRDNMTREQILPRSALNLSIRRRSRQSGLLVSLY